MKFLRVVQVFIVLGIVVTCVKLLMPGKYGFDEEWFDVDEEEHY